MVIQTQFSMIPECEPVSTLLGPQLLCHDMEIYELSKFSKSPIEIKHLLIKKVPGLLKKKTKQKPFFFFGF